MGLRELNLIELPKPKRPEEASKIEEPNFCHYHRILGHTLKGCFVVKNIIQKMIDDGTIDGDLLSKIKKGKKVATSNIATCDDRMVSCENTNMMPTYDQTMMTNPKYVNVTASGHHSRIKSKRRNESKALHWWTPTPKCGKSTFQRSRERRQQLSR